MERSKFKEYDGIWVYLKEEYYISGLDSGTLSFDNVKGFLQEVKKNYIVKREEG